MKKLILFTAMAWVSMTLLPAQKMTVGELFSLITNSSKRMKSQQMAVEHAEQGIDIARDKRLPDISAQLSFSYLGNGFLTDRDFSNYTKADIPHYGNNFALEAQQAVYTGGAVSSGIRMAQIARQQAEVTREEVRQQLCFTALGIYLELYKMDNQIRVYNNNIALTQQLIANVKARQRQGTALRNDVTRYELQLENQKLMMRKLQDERSIMNHQLCTVVELPDQCIMPDTAILSADFTKAEEQEWQTSATASSTLLRQSALNTDMAQQQVRVTKAEKLPKIAIMAADHLDGPITIEVPPINKNFNYWYVGIGVKYDVSSLFKSNKKVHRAQTALLMSREEQLISRDKVENDMQAAYTYFQQSFVELSTQQKSVQLARQNYEVINDRYLNQLALVTDMVDAENMKLEAELREVNARIGIVFAFYKMKFVAGEI